MRVMFLANETKGAYGGLLKSRLTDYESDALTTCHTVLLNNWVNWAYLKTFSIFNLDRMLLNASELWNISNCSIEQTFTSLGQI